MLGVRRQAMLGEEDSLGQEAAENVKEDLKFELAVLNAAMKNLNKNWDFTLLINPLLADQGPAMALVPKLKKQIDRMTKLRDEFLQQKQAEAMPDKPARTMRDKPAGSFQTTRRRRAASREETQPDEFQRTDLGSPPAAPQQALQKRRGPQKAHSDGIVVSEALPMGTIAEVRSCHGSRHIQPFAAMRRTDHCAHEDASPRSKPMQVDVYQERS
jgi:hypothetical protein